MATDVYITIKASGGDYSGILDLNANYPDKDLVSNDQMVWVECDDFEDALAGAVQFNAWTTDATRHIHFYAKTKHGSTGRLTTTSYRITAVGSNSIQLLGLGTNGKIVFEGIQFKTTTGNMVALPSTNAAKTVLLDRCVIEAAAGYGFYQNDDNAACTLTNCYVFGTTAAVRNDAATTLYLYHCTVISETQNAFAQNGGASAVLFARNCYFHGPSDCLAIFSGNTNLTSVATSNADGDIPSIAYSTVNFSGVTLDSEDLRLTSGTALRAAGVSVLDNDWPATCLLDIDCGARPVLGDVGADQYDSSGTLPSPAGEGVDWTAMTETTVTIKATGGDYSGWTDFNSNYPSKDLVAQNVLLFVACDNFEDDVGVFAAVSGWNTSARAYIHAYATTKHNSTGRITTDAYRIKGTNSTGMLLVTDAGDGDGKLVFEGVQFRNPSGHCINILSNNDTETLQLDRCVVDSAGGQGVTIADGSLIATNSFILATTAGYKESTSTGALFYQCTVIGTTTYGIDHGAEPLTVRNSYVHGNTDCLVGAGTETLEKAATSNADGDIPSIAYSTTNFQDVTGDAEDLHLKAGTALLAQGTDLSGEDWPVSCPIDIDCGTRAWPSSVGADEYLATGDLPAAPGGTAPGGPAYVAPPYISPDNTFRDDFPYLKATEYYEVAPPPADIYEWLGGAQ